MDERNNFQPATPAQLNLLMNLNVQVNDRISKREANELIQRAIANQPKQPATPKQLEYLDGLGIQYSQGISKKDASDLIQQAKASAGQHNLQKTPVQPEHQTLKELGIQLNPDMTLGEAVSILRTYF